MLQTLVQQAVQDAVEPLRRDIEELRRTVEAQPAAAPPYALSVKEYARRHGISVSLVRKLIAENKLASRRIGGRRIITEHAS
jgi:excisionase family DNA binding protein